MNFALARKINFRRGSHLLRELGVVRMTSCIGGGESCLGFYYRLARYRLDQEHWVMEFVRVKGFFLTPMKLGVVRMTSRGGDVKNQEIARVE